MSDILIIAGLLVAGMAPGHALRGRPVFLRGADHVASLAVFALLFVLGAGLGHNEELFTRLPILGGTALCISLCSCLGSILFLRPLQRIFDPAARSRPESKAAGGPSPLWGTLRILACFTAGMGLARAGLLPGFLFQSGLVVYALWLLVFCVGIGLGAELKAFAVVREMHVKILAVPLLIVLGTAAGSLAAAFLLGMGARDALAVGCGFGYYSLSSLLIENMGNPSLAAVALLANICRELLGILGAPVAVRLCGSLAPVAAAGATAMDTGLPVIARFAGERAAIAAVFSGMSLTVLVPFLVTAIMEW